MPRVWRLISWCSLLARYASIAARLSHSASEMYSPGSSAQCSSSSLTHPLILRMSGAHSVFQSFSISAAFCGDAFTTMQRTTFGTGHLLVAPAGAITILQQRAQLFPYRVEDQGLCLGRGMHLVGLEQVPLVGDRLEQERQQR